MIDFESMKFNLIEFLLFPEKKFLTVRSEARVSSGAIQRGARAEQLVTNAVAVNNLSIFIYYNKSNA